MRLYELTAEYERLADALVADDGEVLDLAALEAIEGVFSDKVVGLCQIIRQFTAEAEAIDIEVDRLKNMYVRRESAVMRLKANLKSSLERLGVPSFTAGLFKIRIQQSPPSISWTKPIEQLPKELRRTTVEFAASVAREMLKGGLPLPDGVKVETGSHLRIS